MATMIAARLHDYGKPMTLDRIDVPEPRSTDVLVEVKACGIVPNMARVVANFFGTQVARPARSCRRCRRSSGSIRPAWSPRSAIRCARSGRASASTSIRRARCGSCRMCRSGQPLDCPDFTFQGYFGRSQEIMKAYPYGGFCQFITAPEDALVKLPDNVSFEAAARFGYLGTAYAAMKKLGVGPGHTFLVNGISGTLGLSAAMLALAMGATKILGTGRNVALLERVKALAPERIEVFAFAEGKAARRRRRIRWHRLGQVSDRRVWRRLPARLLAARRSGRRDDAGVLHAAPGRPRRDRRRGDGDTADQCVLADDQPHHAARLGLVHHRRGRGDGGDGFGRHA